MVVLVLVFSYGSMSICTTNYVLLTALVNDIELFKPGQLLYDAEAMVPLAETPPTVHVCTDDTQFLYPTFW